MIGIKYKNFAMELGLKVSNGVGYGSFGGYTVTLREGNGWKSVGFSLHFDSDAQRGSALALLCDKQTQKEHRIREVQASNHFLLVSFVDSPRLMQTLRESMTFIAGQLHALGVRGDGCCALCGGELDAGAQTLLIGEAVCRVHSGCAAGLERSAQEQAEAARSGGSVAGGILGAVLGALVGAIPWALAYYFGWFVGWLGFLIGLAAKFGYDLFKGRQTKIKGFVILIVTLAAVIFAEYASIVILFLTDPDVQAMNYGLGQVLSLIRFAARSSEFTSAVVRDVLLGIVFALLGIVGMLRQIFSETSGRGPVRLP